MNSAVLLNKKNDNESRFMPELNEFNPYKILNIPKTASKSDIKKAYYRLALIYHPDKNFSEEAEQKFKEISMAYKMLTNQQALTSGRELAFDVKLSIAGGSIMTSSNKKFCD